MAQQLREAQAKQKSGWHSSTRLSPLGSAERHPRGTEGELRAKRAKLSAAQQDPAAGAASVANPGRFQRLCCTEQLRSVLRVRRLQLQGCHIACRCPVAIQGTKVKAQIAPAAQSVKKVSGNST